jgi:hypothetical protein
MPRLPIVMAVALAGSLAECDVQASLAADTADAGQRILSDPMYLPYAKQVYGTTSYSYASGTFSSFGLSGAEFSHESVRASRITQTVGWGITDEFTLRLSDTYVDDSTTYHFPNSTYSGSLDASGVTNPTLSSTYRAIDQIKGAPVSVDVIAAYSPNLIGGREATFERRGNEGSGRQSFTTTLAVGRVSSTFTIRGSLGAAYLGKRSVEYLVPAGEQTEAYWDYVLSTSMQARLTNAVSINGGYSYTVTGNTTTAYYAFAGDYAGRNSGGDIGDLNIALNYHFRSNALVAQFAYDNLQFGRLNTRFHDLPSSRVRHIDQYIGGRHSDEVTARLYYVF